MKSLGKFVCAASLLCLAVPAPGQTAVTEQSVKKAIADAAEFIFSLANKDKDGVWEVTYDKEGDPLSPVNPVAATCDKDGKPLPFITGKDGKPLDYYKTVAAHIGKAQGPYDYRVYNWGGRTALALNALVLAGKGDDERVQNGVKWLMRQELYGTYALGLRMQLIHILPGDKKEYAAVLDKDYKKLLDSARKAKEGATIWNYIPPPGAHPSFLGDFSNTNYAVLGIWAYSDERQEVQSTVWEGLEKAWINGQDAKSGGWSYQPAFSPNPGAPYGSMTTAGIASLYLIIDNSKRTGKLGSFRTGAPYLSAQKGLTWLTNNFSDKENPANGSFNAYYFYNVERIGASTGLRFIGTHDWFREIAATILPKQQPGGAIPINFAEVHGGQFVDTCFSMMFLSAGSAPVVMNKLQHAGDWDNRLRDLAILSGWIANKVFDGSPANWQIVNLDVSPEELTTSRILYIAGTKALTFTPEQAAKLKRYVDLGGLLVFQADETPNKPFNDSVKKLLEGLWPELTLKTADPQSDPLFNIHYKPRKPRAEVLASPTRVMAYVLDSGPAASWELHQYSSGLDNFQLGANLHYFATDQTKPASLPTKLTYFAGPFMSATAEGTRKIVLARIKYGDKDYAWDPEPLAFERLARLLAARDKIKLEIQNVDIAGLAKSGATFAHLTGSSGLNLTKQESADLQAWIKGGGTLIVDQAGGGKVGGGAFDRSFVKLTDEWFGMDSLHEDLALGQQLGKIIHRNVAGMHTQNTIPRLYVNDTNGGKIVYSKIDLVTGMNGRPNPLSSYIEEDGVYRIFKAILASAQGANTQPADSQPAQ